MSVLNPCFGIFLHENILRSKRAFTTREKSAATFIRTWPYGLVGGTRVDPYFNDLYWQRTQEMIVNPLFVDNFVDGSGRLL